MKNEVLVRDFIDRIWNKQAFGEMKTFIHPGYRDRSLPPGLDPGMAGTEAWIKATGKAFEHETLIEDHVTEGDRIVVRVKMKLKHIGIWRGIEPTGSEVETMGYREFRIQDGKIIEHQALIDGQVIEDGLRHASTGCKVGH